MFFSHFLLSLFLSFCPQTSSSSSARRPPNILFILADDLGFADFDWRDPHLHTPNLRQLAFSPHSVQLLNAYVGPLCTPSRTAMLSGLYPFRTGTQSVFMHADSAGLNPELRLLPQLLRERGYHTHLIGKWHLGYCNTHYLPTSRGFDTFFGYYGSQEGYYNHSTDLTDHRNGGMLLRGLDLFRESDGKGEPQREQNGHYSTDLFADEAIRVLSRHNSSSSAPFFLMLAFQAVHAPLEQPLPPALSRCPPNLPRERLIYCGMLAALDAAIGRLMGSLRDIGEYDRTVLVFGTDNGGDPKFGASNAPLRGGKGTLWEGGTRSTAIVHSPIHIDQFAFRHDLFHAVDWPATFLGAAGSQIKTLGDGINQWAMITGIRQQIRRSKLIYALDFGIKGESAIRVGDFKLLLRRGHRASLFNIASDPFEQRNLADKMPKLAKKMRMTMALYDAKMAKSVTLLRTDPRGWPQKHGGVFQGGWC